MCETCGCSGKDKAVLIDPETMEHSHVDEEGKVYFHTHSDSHAHHHDHALEQHHEHVHECGPEHYPHLRHQHVSEHTTVRDESHVQPTVIAIKEEILSKNNRFASQNRDWLAEQKVIALNLLSSPGSGKTSLLEKTVQLLGESLSIMVIEGDQETVNDAERIKAAGCKVIQINTGTGCHLEADMVGLAMRKLEPAAKSLLFIENVGNLVCPSLFDLGEQMKVVLFSVTEGEDKPLKYPHMFRAADIILLNKIDLLPYLSFDVQLCLNNIQAINQNVPVFQLSASRGDGMDAWISFLRKLVA